MEIIKEKQQIILKDDDKIIEKYDLNEEINFKGLMTFLLEKNLSSRVDTQDKTTDKTDAEENLIKLIQSVINDYNEKVEEFNKFKTENK